MSKTATAAYPLSDFTFPSGGVILKSSDGIEFRVYKNILALASPYFSRMFTQPRSTNGAEPPLKRPTLEYATSSESEVSIIDLPESSWTLDLLLRFVYPTMSPSLPGVSETGQITDSKELVNALDHVIAAALKYDMQVIVEKLLNHLLDAAEKTDTDGKVCNDTLALRVFVLACHYHLKEVAHRAAHASLKGRATGEYIEELRQINAAQYYNLIQFHSRVVERVDYILKNSLGYPLGHSERVKCSSCTHSKSSQGYATWWSNFVYRAYPILSRSPQSDEVFTTDFLHDMFTKAKNCDSAQCRQLPATWPLIAQEIKEDFARAAAKKDIDLSEI